MQQPDKDKEKEKCAAPKVDREALKASQQVKEKQLKNNQIVKK